MSKYPPPSPDSDPKASCPLFDEAIKQIELARSANAELRNNSESWKHIAEWHEIKADELRDKLGEARETIDELQHRIKELEQETANS